MANILYGVNGEGAGHSTRSREVILHLQRQGHQVVAASFDRGLHNLNDVCEVSEIHGFRFAYVNNAVRYNRTVARGIFQARKVVGSTKHSAGSSTSAASIWSSPTSSRSAAAPDTAAKSSVISIDNQHILTHFKLATPPSYRTDATAAKLVTRLMTPYASPTS